MLTDEQIQELRTKYKEVARVASKRKAKDAQGKETKEPEWEVVFRKPTHAEYKRFRAQLHNEAQKPDATENLARVCIVHPSREAFDALLEEFPAVGDAAGGVLSELAGFTADDSAKS